MIALFVSSIITTAVVCILATAIVSIMVKNQIMLHLGKQLRYWQQRALEAEQHTSRMGRTADGGGSRSSPPNA